jgi:predicted PurR-regulated permease PerM
MKSSSEQVEQKRLVGSAIEAAVRIAVLGALAYWCVQIIAPFLGPLVWGAIIAVSVYPVYAKLEKALGGRSGLAAALVSIVLLLLLLVPAVLLTGTLIDGLGSLAQGLRDGTLHIPPPPKEVSDWPLIGKQISSVWTGASENIASLMTTLGPAAVDIGKWLLAAAGSLGMTVLVFFLSVIVAAVFLAYSERSSRMARRLAAKLAGEDGEGYVKAAESTVRSVALGVLGIAFIQSALAGLGMLVAGIPGAGFWAFVCLILAIVQIGGLPVLLPAAIYMFATSDTLSAVLFAIWVVIVGFSDNVLRPLLLGRGTDSPMLVVLIGSLGGMIASGIVGLFVGAVIFTLGYKLFLVWLDANT